MKQGWVSDGIIVLAAVTGLWMGGLVYPVLFQPWSVIGPPNIAVVDMQAYQVRPGQINSGPYLVLGRTSDGRLWSTGPCWQGTGWRWTDISGGHAWSDFPETGAAFLDYSTYELHIRYEGKIYRVDASGRWQLAEGTAGGFPLKKGTEEPISISTVFSFRWFPGVLKLQSLTLSREWVGTDYLFALVKGKGVWYRISGGDLCFGVASRAGLGALCAFAASRLLTAAMSRRMAQRAEAGEDGKGEA